MPVVLQMGKHKIGDNYPVCIVFEAGPTHDGLITAKKLVDMAAEAKADAIKFQMVNAKRLVPSRETMISYEVLVNKKDFITKKITESLQEILQRRELTKEEWKELITYCKSKGILFFSTATFEDEVLLLQEAGCDCIKICSGDINHHYLLRFVAQFDWIIQIDTGNATIGEVEQAVDVLEKAGAKKILINHCPSGYPAHLESINLRVLTTLKQMFPYPVAFSDHSPGHIMDVAALAIGANMLEKTITLDKCIKSPEHIMSLEPHEAAGFVKSIREVEIALGQTRRIITDEGRKKSITARRSVVAACDIAEGSVITQEMLDYARPGDGLPAHLDYLVIGKIARQDIKKNQNIYCIMVK